MQLRLSLVVSFLLANSLYSEDYVSVQYMSYDEDSGRTSIHTPALELNLDLGVDYTLNITSIHDSVSGASPTYYDATSGASATIQDGVLSQSDIRYGDIPYDEDRKALGVSLIKRLESRDELNFGYNYSNENDYKSKEFSFGYLYYLDKSKNNSISLGASYQKNKVDIPCFLGNSECDALSGASSSVVSKDLYVLNTQVGYTQIIDKTSLIKGAVFHISEHGYLTNPYMRVVKDYYTLPKISEEKKPNNRKAYGFSIEYDKAINDKLASLLFYRYYEDSWGITSQTLDVKFFYDINKRFTTGLNFRGYTQSKADFFSGRRDYFTDEKYASSDRRVSKFDSYNYALTFKYKVNNKLKLNCGIGYYKQPQYYDAKYYNIGFIYGF